MFTEVIGDPVKQTRSPAIHKHWLAEIGLDGDYVATRVRPNELEGFLARRRADPAWRGCNVTIPHKERILPFLDQLAAGAEAIGAVNCIVPREGRLTGFNTDIDGVAAALGGVPLQGRKVALIGAGGAARAAVRYLLDVSARPIVLARDPGRAEPLRNIETEVLPLSRAGAAFEDAAAIINASPLGMIGAAPWPEPLLAAVAEHAAGKTLFDMVYSPLETPFLAAGRAAGASCVDGLVMLIGQARSAFRLFFGEEPPAHDETLRRRLLA
ncbi:MAG TPA: shikimate dehydrogenase [Allosphingosinicella sp.]|jgi:shikimate dehydrogenase